MFSVSKQVRTVVSALSAFTLSAGSISHATESTPLPAAAVTKDTLQISDDASRHFPEVSNLLGVAVQQQSTQNGFSADEMIVLQGLLRITLATDLGKPMNNPEQHRQILDISEGEFNRFCLDNGLLVSFDQLISAKTDRRFISEITFCKASVNDKLSAAIPAISEQQRKLFKLQGFEYPAMQAPKVVLIQDKLITNGCDTMATVLDYGKESSIVIFDPEIAQRVFENWNNDEKRNLINGSLANELAHIRNQRLFPDRKHSEKFVLGLGGKKLEASWIECDEAFSDLATLLQSDDHMNTAFNLCMCLAGRGGRYSLSDNIQKIAAQSLLPDDTYQSLVKAGELFDKTRTNKDFQDLMDKTLDAVKRHPGFRTTLIAAYSEALKEACNLKP